jgi:nicotinate-nucleotide adenylyltransferase
MGGRLDVSRDGRETGVPARDGVGALLELDGWQSDRPVGILGGTFDPVHLGHLAVAEQAREALDLAGVLFVPAARPPHKEGRRITDARQRLAMVELAVSGNPTFRVSDLELRRAGPSFAVDTVREVAEAGSREGRPEPFFILSVEALPDFPAWRQPHRILDHCRIAVVPRLGAPHLSHEVLPAELAARSDRFVFLDGPELGHSSSDIRARVAAGRSIRYLVPDAVRSYIRSHHLYTSATPSLVAGPSTLEERT